MIPLSKLSSFIEAICCSDSILWYLNGVVFTPEVPADLLGDTAQVHQGLVEHGDAMHK